MSESNLSEQQQEEDNELIAGFLCYLSEQGIIDNASFYGALYDLTKNSNKGGEI